MKELVKDIVVVGAGVSGYAAAISAAREGKKVLLIEKEKALGGNATLTNVGTICGAFYRSMKEQPRLVESPFLKEFISGVQEMDSKLSPTDYFKGLWILPYQWDKFQEFLHHNLESAGVELLLNSQVNRVHKAIKKITQLEIVTKGKSGTVKPKAVVDSSGNGIVSQLAGLQMISSESYQSASQVFEVNAIASESEFALNMILRKEMVKLIDENSWPAVFKSLTIVPASLQNGRAYFKLIIPDPITDMMDIEKSTRDASEWIKKIFPFLKERISSLSGAVITKIFPQLGVRVQSRSRGSYVLTKEDVLSCRKFEDTVALGTWPLEEWKKNGQVEMEYFAEEEAYGIPARCLTSDEMENLFFAGKNISATTEAIASARVIGTCLQTGFAAGKLAAAEDNFKKNEVIKKLSESLLS